MRSLRPRRSQVDPQFGGERAGTVRPEALEQVVDYVLLARLAERTPPVCVRALMKSQTHRDADHALGTALRPWLLDRGRSQS
jgi:hypothetical protein